MSGFWVLNTLCFAADVFPSRNCWVAPLPSARGQPQGSHSSGWDLPPAGWGLSHQLPGEGSRPSPLPGASGALQKSLLGQSLCFCSQSPQGLLLQGFGEPSCSPAAVLGSGRLMETFIPGVPLHHPAASPEKPPALPMPPPALPTDISFLHPRTGLPQDGPSRSETKLQRHWTGSCPTGLGED